MNPIYEKKSGEDNYEYGLRLIETKVEQKPDDLEWQDIVDAIGLDCHRDTLRKAASVSPYSGYAVMQYFKRKNAIDNRPVDEETSEYIDKLDAKIAEARKETKKFYDQRREFNKLLDAIGRSEHLEDRLAEAAENLRDTVGSIKYADPYQSGDLYEDNEAVLVLCDWHLGMVTKNVWNSYDVETCKERVQSVAEMAAERILLHQCRKLNVVVLGDLIHGAIHVSARVASEELVCEQVMQAAEILAQTVEYLSGFVNETNVYVTYGNHARTVQDKKQNIHADNTERLIPWWLEQRLKGHDDIHVLTGSDDGILFFDVYGYGICASHGDLDKVKQSPRLLTTLLQKKYGESVDYILLADKHHRESFEELGVTAMICGALCGTDEYANNHRLYSSPEQTMLIMSKQCGVDAEYHLRP